MVKISEIGNSQWGTGKRGNNFFPISFLGNLRKEKTEDKKEKEVRRQKCEVK